MSQQYAIATYDSAFKYMVNDSHVRDSLISAFIYSGEYEFQSTLLNGNLVPLVQHQALRNLISGDLQTSLQQIADLPEEKYASFGNQGQGHVHVNQGPFVRLARLRDELQSCFPSRPFQGELDICCLVHHNQHIFIVEIQQIAHDGLLERLWSYCASVYASSRERGETWKNVAHRTVTLLAFVGSGKPDAVDTDEFIVYLRSLDWWSTVLQIL